MKGPLIILVCLISACYVKSQLPEDNYYRDDYQDFYQGCNEVTPQLAPEVLQLAKLKDLYEVVFIHHDPYFSSTYVRRKSDGAIVWPII